jgi:ParB family chromosome partitioning protein
LLALPASVQRRLAAGVLSAGHARALLALDGAPAQEELAARIVAEGLSVRATEEAVLLAGRLRTPRAARTGSPSGRTELGALADALGERLETRVRVEVGRHKGRIVVEFGSREDLERIIGVLAPGMPVADG